MDIHKYIYDLDISMDETKRMDCPVCGGKNTFTVTNNKGMRLWNCYKASCSVGGSLKTNMTVDDIKVVYSSVIKQDDFTCPEYFVPFEEEVTFCMSYDFSEIYNHFCVYDAKEDRAVFKIFNDDGSHYFKKHKIFLYKEDFNKFQDVLNESIDYIFKNKGQEIISASKNEPQDNDSSFNDANFEDI